VTESTAVELTKAQRLEHGLLALAQASSNSREAERILAAQDIRIPHQTLYVWSKKHAERLGEIKAKEMPKIRREIADEHAATSRRLIQMEGDVAEELHTERQSLDPKDKVAFFGKLGLNAGIHADKARQWNEGQSDRPPQLDGIDVLRGLKALGAIVPDEMLRRPDPPLQPPKPVPSTVEHEEENQ
jgi:hypothetical protein